jgi:hypothetical protein
MTVVQCVAPHGASTPPSASPLPLLSFLAQVNTLSTATASHGCLHTEVAYADGIDISTADNAEQHAVRFRDKALRKPRLAASVLAAAKVAGACVRQNNTVDMFEHYFHGTESEMTQEDRAPTMHCVSRLMYVQGCPHEP